MTAPAPGIYEGIPAEDYHAWDAVSSSRLRQLRRTPLHCFHAMTNGDEDTVEKTRGSACHACILEPDIFEAAYAIGPDVKLNTKEGKTAWEAFCGANPDKVHLRGAEGSRVLGMREAVWNHAGARHLLEAADHRELSIVWTDGETGELCKARIDVLITKDGVCVDLKSSRDASPRGFSRAIEAYGYHIQGSHYLRGLATVGLPCDLFANIVFEPEPPYAVAAYYLNDETLAVGDDEQRRLLIQFSKCRNTNNWPGYGSTLAPLGLPAWAFSRDYEPAEAT